MEMESKFGQMGQNTKVSINSIKLMEKVNIIMLMEMFMTENGLTIKLKA